MAFGTVRSVDFMVNTDFATNVTNAIDAVDVQDGAESSGAIVLSPNGVKTANYTAVITDRGCTLPMNTASGTTSANATYTIPPHSSVAFPNGVTLALLWVNGAAIQPAFAAGGGVSIVPAASLTLRAPGSRAMVWQYSQDVWYLEGDVT